MGKTAKQKQNHYFIITVAIATCYQLITQLSRWSLYHAAEEQKLRLSQQFCTNYAISRKSCHYRCTLSMTRVFAPKQVSRKELKYEKTFGVKRGRGSLHSHVKAACAYVTVSVSSVYRWIDTLYTAEKARYARNYFRSSGTSRDRAV